MDRLLQDLRFAGRLLWKDRSFSLTTIATLALCLAANVAIFAVVNGVLLKPLPFPEPDRLVRMFNKYPGAGVDAGGSNGVPDYFDRKRDMAALEETALFREAGVTISGSGLAKPNASRRCSSRRRSSACSARSRIAASSSPRRRASSARRRSSSSPMASGSGCSAAAMTPSARTSGWAASPTRVVGVLPPEFVFLNPDIQLFRPAAFTARDKSDESRHSNNWQQIRRG